MVALSATGYALLAGRPRSQSGGQTTPAIAEFDGSGSHTTEPFRVREGWHIQWEHEGDRFALSIKGDRDFGPVITRDEPGSGVTSPVGQGSFYLEIIARGRWSIRVVQGH